MDAALTHLLGFVQAWARDAEAAPAEGALDDEQWRAANAPVLAGVLDPGAYPLAVRVGNGGGDRAPRGLQPGGCLRVRPAARRMPASSACSPADAYEFGLQVILDGFDALIGDRGRPAL